MNKSNSKLRSFRIGLPLALALVTALLIGDSAYAHNVIGIDGKPTHKHVYKQDAYGNGTIAGHAAKPPGGGSIVIWQSSPEQSYQRAQPGMIIPSDPWSKKSHKLDQKQMFNKKPAYKNGQLHVPVSNPQ